MDTITVNKKDLVAVAQKGGQWAITKEAEEYIDQLATIKEWAEEALESVKASIVESLKDTDSRTIRGKKYSASIRAWGDKYSTTNPEFQQEVSYVKADVSKISEYYEEHGELPQNVTQKVQEIKCSFRKRT